MILKDIHSRRKEGYKPNTFIENSAIDFPTKEILASALRTEASTIKDFQIYRSNISFFCDSNYYNPACFTDTKATSFVGLDRPRINNREFSEASTILFAIFPQAQSLGKYTFNKASSLSFLYAESVTSLSGQRPLENTKLKNIRFPNVYGHYENFQTFYRASAYEANRIYIPNLTFRALSEYYERAIFNSIKNGTKLYLNPAMETINDGSPDGAILYAIDRGAEIIYVQNQTPPAAIADLSISNRRDNSCQLNFSPPPSTNPLDFYEVYIDDGSILSKHKPFAEISKSGETITGLPSGNLKISIKVADSYYNLSEKSNKVMIII